MNKLCADCVLIMLAINVSKDIGREIGIDAIFPDIGEEQKNIRTFHFHWIIRIDLKEKLTNISKKQTAEVLYLIHFLILLQKNNR